MGSFDFNSVIVMGRLVADPKIDKISSGATRTIFSIANNYYSKNGGGVNFFEIFCFGKLAEICQQYLKKGKLILVNGELRQSKWQDKITGKPRTKISIFMKELKMLGGKKEDNNEPKDDQDMLLSPQPNDDDEVPF